MSRIRIRSTAYAVGLVLALAALQPARGAVAAEPPGTLRIHVVDSAGLPLTGAVGVFDNGFGSRGQKQADSIFEFSLAPGSYGVFSRTPWGGIVCRGLEACDEQTPFPNRQDQVDPATALVVSSGGTTEVTLQAGTPATLKGSPIVGAQLKASVSDAVQAGIDYMGLNGLTGAVDYEWLRDGEGIDATGSTYTPVVDDAGHVLSVRLRLSGIMTYQLGPNVIGGDLTPRILSAGTIQRVSSRSYVALAASPITTAQRVAVRADVIAATGLVRGTVKVTVGKRTWTLPLRNGVGRLRLPKLTKGTYVVRATYPGSSTYLGSVSAKKKLVVKAEKRPPH